MTDSIWPSQKIVAAGLRGLAQVYSFQGRPWKGIQSSIPWVIWNTEAAICMRCSMGLQNPPPVELDKEKAILATGVGVYAQHILATLLYPFAREHAACEEKAA